VSCWIVLRKAKLGTHRKILHLRLTMLWLRNHPHLAGNLPYPSPIINYWVVISLFSPSHRLSCVLKAPEAQKHTRLVSSFHLGLTMLPFVFPFPNLCFLPWILPGGIQGIWKSSDQTAPELLTVSFEVWWPLAIQTYQIQIKTRKMLPNGECGNLSSPVHWEISSKTQNKVKVVVKFIRK
jgi:hypothetical protein